MKNYLIVYYSRTGNCKNIAEKLYKFLGEENSDIEEIVDEKNREGIQGYISSVIDASKNHITKIKPTSKQPSDYVNLIIITPIWVGKVADGIRTYIAAHSADIRSLFLITSSMATQGTVAQKDILLKFALKTKRLLSFTKNELKKENYDALFAELLNNKEEKNEE